MYLMLLRVDPYIYYSVPISMVVDPLDPRDPGTLRPSGPWDLDPWDRRDPGTLRPSAPWDPEALGTLGPGPLYLL